MNNFQIIFDNYEKLNEVLKEYKTIHIFFDDNIQIADVNLLASKIKHKNIIKSGFPNAYASENFVQNIAFQKENFVICMGGLHLQSITKYYAYQNQIDYAIIPIHEITEYSFSKIAYVKDNYFCFYECEKPVFVFIMRDFFNSKDIKLLSKILSYKNIVEFEFEFEKDILECAKENISSVVNCINLRDENLKSIIKIYGVCAAMLDSVKTYDFLGTEYNILSLLMKSNNDILQNLVIAQNVLYKFYDCLFKFDIIDGSVNVNYHLLKLKKLYNIDMSSIVNNIKIMSAEIKNKIKGRYYAYMPYLKKLFLERSVNFSLSFIDYSGEKIEGALALSCYLQSKPSILSFAKDFGYFEKIIKEI